MPFGPVSDRRLALWYFCILRVETEDTHRWNTIHWFSCESSGIPMYVR